MALGMFVICHDSYLLACLSWFLPHVICHGHCPSISVPFTPFHFCTLFPECSILRGEGDLMQTRIGSYIRVDLWMAIVVTSPTTPPPTYLCPRWRKPRDYSPNALPNNNSPQFQDTVSCRVGDQLYAGLTSLCRARELRKTAGLGNFLLQNRAS